MPKYILAHDLGTSGNKATLYSTTGQLVASANRSYDTYYSHGSWVEQDPAAWWKAVSDSTRELVQNVDVDRIVCVSFSAQMNGCLCVDKEGVPLRNSIIHSDLRATKEIERLLEKLDSGEFYRITGHRPSASYSLAKLIWLKNNEPEVYRNTYKMIQAKDYLAFKFTGKIVTDYNDASGTNAFDLHANKWSEKIIEAAEIDLEKFPEPHQSTYIVGEVTSRAAEETGLKAGIPVVLGAGDGGCSTIGAGSVRPGLAYNYIGSSSWIGLTTESPIIDEEMRTVTWAHPIPGYFNPIGTMQAGGTSYSWLKNEICKFETEQARVKGVSPYDLINQEIEKSPPGARGVLFLPYLLGERAPHWNPKAKGGFIGITAGHKRADLFRAVMEGVSYNLNTILRIFDQHVDIESMVVIGGGAKGEVWRQMLADIYQRKILKPNRLVEATSVGAAVIGGIGAGVFQDFEVVNEFIAVGSEHHPNLLHKEVYEQTYQVFLRCYEALVGIFDDLSALSG